MYGFLQNFPAQHSFDIYFDIKETFNLSKLLFVLLSSAIEENGCQLSSLFPRPMILVLFEVFFHF